MVNRYIFAVAGLAAQLNALPLNINLGAYSPALVVGDGEISFGGRNDVSQLMSVLEGAAVNAAQGAANAPGAAPAAPAQQPQQPQQPAAPAARPAEGGATPVTAASDNGQINEAQAIAALQGMGKEIAPRVQLTKARVPAQKRDLAGFDRALKFAEAALTKGPKVQLGTGEGGSGVGMVIDPTRGGAAGGGAAGGGAAEGGAGGAAGGANNQPQQPQQGRPEGSIVAQQKVKARSDEPQQAPRRRAKVTTMYVRSGVPAGVDMTPEKLVTRDVPIPPVARQVMPAANNLDNLVQRSEEDLSKRGSGGAIDTVNLNVSGEGVTMTFVETEAEGAAEDEQ